MSYPIDLLFDLFGDLLNRSLPSFLLTDNVLSDEVLMSLLELNTPLGGLIELSIDLTNVPLNSLDLLDERG